MENMNTMERWHMRCAEMPGRSRIFLHGNSLCECNTKSLKPKAVSFKLIPAIGTFLIFLNFTKAQQQSHKNANSKE